MKSVKSILLIFVIIIASKSLIFGVSDPEFSMSDFYIPNSEIPTSSNTPQIFYTDYIGIIANFIPGRQFFQFEFEKYIGNLNLESINIVANQTLLLYSNDIYFTNWFAFELPID